MTIEQLTQQIKESNDLFEQADPATKRMMIAQDCLDRIEANQLIPCHGSLYKLQTYPVQTSVKETLECNDFECQICAKGGLFMSYVGRVNQVNWEDAPSQHYHSSRSMRKLMEIFSGEQLSLIESAFEGQTYEFEGYTEVEVIDGVYRRIYDDPEKEAERKRAVNMFGGRLAKSFVFEMSKILAEDNRRLKIICQNIIDNKGTFIPSPNPILD